MKHKVVVSLYFLYSKVFYLKSLYFGFFLLCAGIVSDDDSSKEKESKQARIEVSNETKDDESVSRNIETDKAETPTENDQSPDKRV